MGKVVEILKVFMVWENHFPPSCTFNTSIRCKIITCVTDVTWDGKEVLNGMKLLYDERIWI